MFDGLFVGLDGFAGLGGLFVGIFNALCIGVFNEGLLICKYVDEFKLFLYSHINS